MPKYITHGSVHKKGLGKQRVSKQTSGQNVKGEKQIWKRRALAAIAGRLCEGHVALRHTPRLLNTKASSAPVPGLLKYSNEIALIR